MAGPRQQSALTPVRILQGNARIDVAVDPCRTPRRRHDNTAIWPSPSSGWATTAFSREQDNLPPPARSCRLRWQATLALEAATPFERHVRLAPELSNMCFISAACRLALRVSAFISPESTSHCAEIIEQVLAIDRFGLGELPAAMGLTQRLSRRVITKGWFGIGQRICASTAQRNAQSPLDDALRHCNSPSRSSSAIVQQRAARIVRRSRKLNPAHCLQAASSLAFLARRNPYCPRRARPATPSHNARMALSNRSDFGGCSSARMFLPLTELHQRQCIGTS